MSKIVFDIETKNTFNNVGGNLDKFEVSVVGVYSYDKDEYKCFDENQMPELGELLKTANPLIGFNSKAFDVPILDKYFNYKLSAVPHFDIHEELEKILGHRIGLGVLGKANLGLEKTESTGLKAIKMYKEGDMENLKKYCLQDVRITKEIFDKIVKEESLWIPQRNLPQMKKIEIKFEEEDNNQDQLI